MIQDVEALESEFHRSALEELELFQQSHVDFDQVPGAYDISAAISVGILHRHREGGCCPGAIELQTGLASIYKSATGIERDRKATLILWLGSLPHTRRKSKDLEHSQVPNATIRTNTFNLLHCVNSMSHDPNFDLWEIAEYQIERLRSPFWVRVPLPVSVRPKR